MKKTEHIVILNVAIYDDSEKKEDINQSNKILKKCVDLINNNSNYIAWPVESYLVNDK